MLNASGNLYIFNIFNIVFNCHFSIYCEISAISAEFSTLYLTILNCKDNALYIAEKIRMQIMHTDFFNA